MTVGDGRRWFKPADDGPGVAVVLREGQLVVGTDVGVFTSSTRGGSWARLGTGLPNVSTFDVNLDPSGERLVAATHGRGPAVRRRRAAAGWRLGDEAPASPERQSPGRWPVSFMERTTAEPSACHSTCDRLVRSRCSR